MGLYLCDFPPEVYGAAAMSEWASDSLTPVTFLTLPLPPEWQQKVQITEGTLCGNSHGCIIKTWVN